MRNLIPTSQTVPMSEREIARWRRAFVALSHDADARSITNTSMFDLILAACKAETAGSAERREFFSRTLSEMRQALRLARKHRETVAAAKRQQSLDDLRDSRRNTMEILADETAEWNHHFLLRLGELRTINGFDPLSI